MTGKSRRRLALVHLVHHNGSRGRTSPVVCREERALIANNSVFTFYSPFQSKETLPRTALSSYPHHSITQDRVTLTELIMPSEHDGYNHQLFQTHISEDFTIRRDFPRLQVEIDLTEQEPIYVLKKIDVKLLRDLETLKLSPDDAILKGRMQRYIDNIKSRSQERPLTKKEVHDEIYGKGLFFPSESGKSMWVEWRLKGWRGLLREIHRLGK